jgi:hypothetical protein
MPGAGVGAVEVVFVAWERVSGVPGSGVSRDGPRHGGGDCVGTTRKPLKAVQEFHTFIDHNRAFIPNYGGRFRYGERISIGFLWSTADQVINKRFCKKQQMQRTKWGAHLL